MKRLTILLALLATVAAAAPPQSLDGAWTYISAKGHSERWLVVSPKKSRDAYLECENLDDVVRCVIPVWTRQTQQQGRFLPVGGRRAPYPEVAGAQLKEMLDRTKVAQAEEVLKAQGLAPFLVYSQVKNEQMQLVGTQCDLRVVIPLTFSKFEGLVTSYLKEVYAASPAEGYDFQTNN